MALNPNWPVIEAAWGAWNSTNSGDSPRDRWVDVTPLLRGRNGTQRGRQFELDQVRAGEHATQLLNTNGQFDPTNTSGPYYGHVQPFQPYRVRAQWPPSINLLTPALATGGDAGGVALGTITASSDLDVYSNTDSAGGSIVTDGTAYQGSRVLQFNVPSASTSTTRIAHCPQVAVYPGQAYTFQMRVRDVTASTSLQVNAFIGWYTASSATPTTFVYGSTATLTGSPTAGWTQITVTATAPAGVMGIDVGVTLAANAAATCSVQTDAWQSEKGSSASAWVQPGTWYPIYSGFVERWPQQWTFNGTYGTVQPTATDAFSLLSQKVLSDPLTQEINSHSPRFLFKLDDPQGSTSAADATGSYPAAQVAAGKYGVGSLTFGSQITSASAGGAYTGSSGTVVTVSNANPGTNILSGATFLSLSGSGIKGPASTAWTRMVAFRYTGPTPTSDAYIWTAIDNTRPVSVSQILLNIDPSGHLFWGQNGPGGGISAPFSASLNVVDSNWHLAIFGHDGVSVGFTSLDGNYSQWSIGSGLVAVGIAGDSLGNYDDPTVGNGTSWNYKGDISFAAEFPSVLSNNDCANLYAAWKSACAGESTDTRYKRILRYAGFSGPQSVQTGLTTSMGAMSTAGQDAVTALQSVVDTENGAHYMDRYGAINFKARSDRYNKTTPTYIFGERTDLGEWPYEGLQLDFDPTRLANQVTVTQSSTNQLFYAQDQTSITNYYPRTLTRTINANSTFECQDAANYLISRYKNPVTRVANLKLHPSANPALWPICLSLDLGTRIRVMRRPPGLNPIQLEVIVEAIDWSMDDQGEAWCTLQCSPADTTPYGIFAAWHTTLASSISAGVTSITVNASQDNTNPLAAQLPAGQQIVLGQNTANQETVTISAVGATSPGWATATITLTAATTKSHTAGDLVNEPLPAGTTDPTTWDAVSAFDAVAFAY